MRFNTAGGIGDIVLHCWHAEGYKSLGIPCDFYSTDQRKSEILRIFGQDVTNDSTGAVETGGKAQHYSYEITVDKGANPRTKVWSSRLPNNPPAIRPPHAIPDKCTETMTKAKRDLCGDEPLVLLFPFADWHARMWPLAHWVDLAWGLREKGVATAMLSNRQDAGSAFPFFYWNYGWGDIMALMKSAALVVANDSGPSHISGTLGVQTMAMMGPTSNIFTHCPEVTEMRVPKETLSCVGCHFDRVRGYRRACDVQCQALMRMTPDVVRDDILRRLHGRINQGPTPS